MWEAMTLSIESNIKHNFDLCITDFDSILQCRNVTRPPQTTYGPTGPSWHMETSGNKVVLVNSAFYDDRPKGGDLPSLQLLSIADIYWDTQLYCYVWYPGVRNPHIVGANLFRHFYKRQNPVGINKYLPSKGIFEEYIIQCRLPTNQSIPSHVSVVAHACVASTILVPVEVPQKPQHTINFGICVAPSFGKIHTEVMVEWFELHKILGVKEFNIYNVSLDESMGSVLQYYISSGDLILHHMSPIIPTTDDLTAYMNSLPILNHCLFTNMYRYEHIVIVDFDEFITPKGKKNTTYPQLVKYINEHYNLSNSWTSYTFQNEFFFYDFPADESQPYYLPVLQQRLRYLTTPSCTRPKSMFNPNNCIIAGNHRCLLPFPGANDGTVVAPELATSHHYRKCDTPLPYKNGTCVYLKTQIADDTMLKYKEILARNVQPVLRKFGFFD